MNAEIKLAQSPDISAEVQADIDACHFPGLLQADMCTRVVDFLKSFEPQIVKFARFNQPLKSRPKRVWGIANDAGEYPLYTFGQSKESYSLMDPMPDLLREVANFLESHFDHPEGFLTLAMATYYHNGTENHIPPHQDKSVSKESTGKEESQAPIYNISFLAVRPFTITKLALLGAFEDKPTFDIAPYVLKSIPMETGDVVRLTPLLNASTAHMVPKDPSVTELRISLVFRHCDKRWVKPNEYHYDMVQRGRVGNKTWHKGPQKSLAAEASNGPVPAEGSDGGSSNAAEQSTTAEGSDVGSSNVAELSTDAEPPHKKQRADSD